MRRALTPPPPPAAAAPLPMCAYRKNGEDWGDVAGWRAGVFVALDSRLRGNDAGWSDMPSDGIVGPGLIRALAFLF